MSKSIKTIATIAAVAGAAWAAAPALGATGAAAGTTAGVGSQAAAAGGALTSTAPAAATSVSSMTTTAAAQGGLMASNAVVAPTQAGLSMATLKTAANVGGLAMQGLGLVQGQLAKAEAADVEKEQQRLQGRIAEADAQKARIANIRQQRILQGRTEAAGANAGFSPANAPSSIATGLSALGTQTAVAQADIGGRVEAARSMASNENSMYSAMNSASGWQAFGSLGESIWKNSDTLAKATTNIGSTFKTIFS